MSWLKLKVPLATSYAKVRLIHLPVKRSCYQNRSDNSRKEHPFCCPSRLCVSGLFCISGTMTHSVSGISPNQVNRVARNTGTDIAGLGGVLRRHKTVRDIAGWVRRFRPEIPGFAIRASGLIACVSIQADRHRLKIRPSKSPGRISSRWPGPLGPGLGCLFRLRGGPGNRPASAGQEVL